MRTPASDAARAFISGSVSSLMAATTTSSPCARAASSNRKGKRPLPAISPSLFIDERVSHSFFSGLYGAQYREQVALCVRYAQTAAPRRGCARQRHWCRETKGRPLVPDDVPAQRPDSSVSRPGAMQGAVRPQHVLLCPLAGEL